MSMIPAYNPVPCPICGCAPIIEPYGVEKLVRIGCPKCELELSGFASADIAARRWRHLVHRLQLWRSSEPRHPFERYQFRNVEEKKPDILELAKQRILEPRCWALNETEMMAGTDMEDALGIGGFVFEFRHRIYVHIRHRFKINKDKRDLKLVVKDAICDAFNEYYKEYAEAKRKFDSVFAGMPSVAADWKEEPVMKEPGKEFSIRFVSLPAALFYACNAASVKQTPTAPVRYSDEPQTSTEP